MSDADQIARFIAGGQKMQAAVDLELRASCEMAIAMLESDLRELERKINETRNAIDLLRAKARPALEEMQ